MVRAIFPLLNVVIAPGMSGYWCVLEREDDGGPLARSPRLTFARAIVAVDRLELPSTGLDLPSTGLELPSPGQNAGVLLDELVRASAAVTGTSSRRAKIDAIARLLRAAEPAEVPVAVAFLSGELRQRQIGVGYAALRDGGAWPTAAAGEVDQPGRGLTLAAVDTMFAKIGAAGGPGSQAERRRLLASLFAEAGPAERSFLARLIAGDLRQGALEGVMIEAIAAAAGVAAAEVRRAHMLGGSLLAVASAALSPAGEPGDGPGQALAALRSFRLQVGRPLQPMLAGSADNVQAALERVRPAAVEWKIDGIRVQVHKDGGDVAVFTRTLDDITGRVPEVVTAAAALPVHAAVLDGEIIALCPGGRPRPFQVTAGRTGTRSDVARLAREVPLTVFFFDLLHLDGADLVDTPAAGRFAQLAATVPDDLLIPRIVTGTDTEAAAFFADAVARGHEGVLVKSLGAPYAAGRRGAGWIKVKPRHTLDLVVIAAEWGHGRRRGWLSNLHLAARDPAGGGHVMLGKTFKGLTDEILAWQTTRLLELADPPLGRSGAGGAGMAEPGGHAGWVVRVRPELVVEIAFEGVQASPRYPGGLALRFARVLRYRPDKRAADADTIDTIRQIAGAAGLAAGQPGPESAGKVLDPVDEV
jgi:ATP-dependent DNA ligase I